MARPLYDTERYRWRGHFSESRSIELASMSMLKPSPSASTGPTTNFPARNTRSAYEQTPFHFKFSFKVTDAITIKRFLNYRDTAIGEANNLIF